MTEGHDDMFVGWRAPAAPTGLEQRALAAARDPQVTPIQRRIEDRIWESRGLRIGWLAAASILLSANMLLTNDVVVAQSQSEPEIAADKELDIGIELPPFRGEVTTLGDANKIAIALLDEPCLDPSTEGDCT